MENEQNPIPKENKNRIKYIFIVLGLLIAAALFYKYGGVIGQDQESLQPAENNQQNNQAQITLRIDTGTNTYEYKEIVGDQTNVFDLLKQTAAKEGFSVSSKDSAVGAYIEEIQGVKNDSQSGKFWLFYLNSQLSQTGASETKLTNGDVVEWKYGSM